MRETIRAHPADESFRRESHGTFHLTGVHMENLTVDLKLIGPADCYERTFRGTYFCSSIGKVNMKADRGDPVDLQDRDRMGGDSGRTIPILPSLHAVSGRCVCGRNF